MGWLKKVTKAATKLVNHVPGGKYITGSEAKRQRGLYNNALNDYNNYAAEAQRTIDDMNSRLYESTQKLKSIEQQKHAHTQNSYQLQAHVDRYQQGLQNLEQQKMQLGNESAALQTAFESFKSKAPQLAGKISEVQKLPNNFQQMFESILQKKESLKGLTEDEAGREIGKYRADVENLKKHREETEQNIRKSLDEITQQHTGLSSERANLEQRLYSYQNAQNRLLQDTGHFNNARSQLESIIGNYKNEQQRLEGEYTSYKSQTDNLNNQLNSYVSSAEAHLNNLGGSVGFRANKFKKASSNTGIMQGLGLAALTFGVGSYLAPAAAGTGASAGAAVAKGSSFLGSLGTGLQYAAPVLGIGHYMNMAGKGKMAAGWERIALNHDRAANYNNLASLSHGGFGSSKVTIPELGGLKQSLSHFNMPTVPRLQDLPKLGESLGKISSLGDIEGLSLGLPQMTSADGKKYSSEVLYDMDFLKKLKKVSRNLGAPYLKSPYLKNNAIIPNYSGSNVKYA